MLVKLQHFVLFVTFSSFLGCGTNPVALYKVEGKELPIDESIAQTDSIERFIAPFRQHIDTQLSYPLAFNKYDLSKNDGELNTAIGILVADVVFDHSNRIFNIRTGKNIDFVLLNHGGIRSIMSKGTVTTRTAYEVMPFENYAVVVELTGKKVEEMLVYLAERKRAHPLSGIKITLNADYSLKECLIQGKPLQKDKTYFVATSNYLANMGGNTVFFENPVSTTETDYLLRNMLIDYFKKVDTVAPVKDDRFIRIN